MNNARKYEKLGREVARLVGDGPGAESVRRQRQAFLTLVSSTKRTHPGHRRYLLAAAILAIMVVGAFVLVWTLSPSRMSFWIGSETNSGSEGEWLRAPAHDPLPVRFEDGTRIEISARSSVRILNARQERVEIELSLGTIKASINRRSTKSSWTVIAGGYSITALGTVFEVNWNPAKHHLAVKVWQGNVVLEGDGIQEQGIVVDAHRELTITEDGVQTVTRIGEARKKIPADPEEPVVLVEPLGPVQNVEEQHQRGEAKKKESRVASLRREPEVTWQEYYDSRMYEKVLAEAEKHGLDKMYESLGDVHLWQLANAARYTKRSAVAIQALLSLRSRFQDSSKAPVAAFLLGRISSEINQDHRAACGWFQVYLQEYPGGKLAEESLGRSIDSCKRAGMTEKAVRAAERYIEQYPRGSYANTANSVLSK